MTKEFRQSPTARMVKILIVGMTLAGCQATAPKSAAKPAAVAPAAAAPAPASTSTGAWAASTLSDAAQEKILRRVRVYQQCVNDQTRAHINDQADSRQIADLILQSCENALGGVTSALLSEQVPEPNAELYVRGKRSRAAQQVLRAVMAVQAQRSVSPGS